MRSPSRAPDQIKSIPRTSGPELLVCRSRRETFNMSRVFSGTGRLLTWISVVRVNCCDIASSAGNSSGWDQPGRKVFNVTGSRADCRQPYSVIARRKIAEALHPLTDIQRMSATRRYPIKSIDYTVHVNLSGEGF